MKVETRQMQQATEFYKKADRRIKWGVGLEILAAILFVLFVVFVLAVLG